MAYKLEEINFKTVADPKGFVEEGDAAYQARVSKAAQLIAENRKNAPSSCCPARPAPARPLPR